MMARPFHKLLRFRRDESGATLVELALVMPLLLILMFGFIDFARLGFTYVMTGKAMDRAVRMAVVLTPPCPNVPVVNARGTFSVSGLRFGTACSANDDLCEDTGVASCALDGTHPTSATIWASIQPLMPTNASGRNVELSYEFTADLGFLGGPYTPIVTARITDLDFQFITPLGALAGLVGASNSTEFKTSFTFPSMSASLPAEALSDGELS
ncbi:MAG: TadE/TadG family type IV pilus assembly protein [Sulfitobacter sp.]